MDKSAVTSARQGAPDRRSARAVPAGALAALLLAAPPAMADPPAAYDRTHCRMLDFEARQIATCTIDPDGHELVLTLGDGAGGLGTLRRFVDRLPAGRVTVAMNAGMWRTDPDFAAVGLHVEDGRQLAPLETDEGDGNFYLKPNGVFFMDTDGRPAILESAAFAAAAPRVRLATQSGPLMVSGGAIHPRIILPTSPHEKIRNGIGVTADGLVVFALSLDPVSFGLFARAFRDALSAPDALYLDGEVSRMHAPALGLEASAWRPLGPMIAAVRR